MNRKIITICYRKIIDARSPGRWEKLVFEDSYTEFLIQSQLYNPEKKYTRFSDILQYAPGAKKLHFLVSAAVVNYIKPLNSRMPDITSNLGKSFLHFQHYFFDWREYQEVKLYRQHLHHCNAELYTWTGRCQSRQQSVL